jgi:hypothetical protein
MHATAAAKILKRAKYRPKMKLTIIKANTKGPGPRMIRDAVWMIEGVSAMTSYDAIKTCIFCGSSGRQQAHATLQRAIPIRSRSQALCAECRATAATYASDERRLV